MSHEENIQYSAFVDFYNRESQTMSSVGIKVWHHEWATAVTTELSNMAYLPKATASANGQKKKKIWQKVKMVEKTALASYMH